MSLSIEVIILIVFIGFHVYYGDYVSVTKNFVMVVPRGATGGTELGRNLLM